MSGNIEEPFIAERFTLSCRFSIAEKFQSTGRFTTTEEIRNTDRLYG
ncbi:MAG: hypothetical protein LC102_12015 [Ignavibacteriales bacterium]|nr:hypothetical protein [Ignavibacteria bacterium]MBZ0196964.1 hypothetical protein [Ignavibacteriaceae bacterium]MCZ2144137.1 hypothetical protein [Ignavibacteriales bacterium]WKZ72620.1 MAG: hypothetical protein QY308_00130 [Ignavibacteriaceae bacterium]